MKKFFHYFTPIELIIVFTSIIIISLTFFIFDGDNYFSYIASIIGVMSLILNAKGNFIGQIIGIVFCTFYAVISWSYRYYGEVITYFGMTMPFAIVSLVSWIKNPYKDNKTEVTVNSVKIKEILICIPFALTITFIFYFILRSFNTSNLLISTVSVLTSTVAVYLTFRRSPYFALAYALNDIVLIVLWTIASINNVGYVSIMACFVAFLLNDIYGFIAWEKMRRRQNDN